MPTITHTVPVRSPAGKHHASWHSVEHGGVQGAEASGARAWNRRDAELMTNFSRIAYCSEREILDWSCATCNETMKGFEVFYKERENMRHVGVYAGILLACRPDAAAASAMLQQCCSQPLPMAGCGIATALPLQACEQSFVACCNLPGYFPKEDKAVIVFRGTDYLVNWIQDLMVYKVDSDYDCGYHHHDSGSRARSRLHAGTNASLQAPPKPRKRKCRVHSGFKYDWLSVRDQVLVACLLRASERALGGAGEWSARWRV